MSVGEIDFSGSTPYFAGSEVTLGISHLNAVFCFDTKFLEKYPSIIEEAKSNERNSKLNKQPGVPLTQDEAKLVLAIFKNSRIEEVDSPHPYNDGWKYYKVSNPST